MTLPKPVLLGTARRTATHRTQTAPPNPDRSPNPGLIPGNHALLPYPHRRFWVRA